MSVHERGDDYVVSFTLKNTGKRAGEEVAQVYAGPSGQVSAPQAVRKLVGYQKASLKPGQVKRVSITVDRHQLEHWNTDSQTWQLGTGRRTFTVGGSSADLALHSTIKVS